MAVRAFKYVFLGKSSTGIAFMRGLSVDMGGLNAHIARHHRVSSNADQRFFPFWLHATERLTRITKMSNYKDPHS
jgi:uncharacterized hydantoinase/oxoprolinase family protein